MQGICTGSERVFIRSWLRVAMSRRTVAATVIAAGLIVGLVAWTLRAVRVAVLDDTLRGFNVPTEQRSDRDLYLTVFPAPARALVPV